MGKSVEPTWEQDDYAFYEDGSETDATLIGSAGTKQTLRFATVYHCRFAISDTTGSSKAANPNLTCLFQYQRNGTGWTTISTSTAVKFVDNDNLTDGGTTTDRHPTGVGTFGAGRIYESANTSATAYTAPDDGTTSYTEIVLHFQVDDTGVMDSGDSVDLRIVEGDSTLLSGTYVLAQFDIAHEADATPQLTPLTSSAAVTVAGPRTAQATPEFSPLTASAIAIRLGTVFPVINYGSELLREPHLMMPDKGRRLKSTKPMSAVKIDWTHPLSKNLANAYVWRTGRVAHNLVTGLVEQLHSSMEVTHNQLQLINHTNVSDLTLNSKITETNNVTVNLRVRKTDSFHVASNMLLALRDGTLSSDLFGIYPFDTTNGDGLRVFVAAGTRIDINDETDNDEFQNFTIRLVPEGSDVRTYAYHNERSITGTTFTAASAGTLSTVSVGGWNGASQLCSNMELSHVFIWSEALTSAQCLEINRNPYQFLIPV